MKILKIVDFMRLLQENISQKYLNFGNILWKSGIKSPIFKIFKKSSLVLFLYMI